LSRWAVAAAGIAAESLVIWRPWKKCPFADLFRFIALTKGSTRLSCYTTPPVTVSGGLERFKLQQVLLISKTAVTSTTH